MTWHLKDRELEKNLIKVDPEFLSKLNTACETLDTNKDGDFYKYQACVVKLNNYGKTIGELFLTGGDIEYKTTYNPHAWNPYPEVTPPEGVWMRVEASDLDDYGEKLIVKFFGAFYVEGAWRSSVDIKDLERFRIFRFRPWED